jgi:hypothetical protein
VNVLGDSRTRLQSLTLRKTEKHTVQSNTCNGFGWLYHLNVGARFYTLYLHVHADRQHEARVNVYMCTVTCLYTLLHVLIHCRCEMNVSIL